LHELSDLSELCDQLLLILILMNKSGKKNSNTKNSYGLMAKKLKAEMIKWITMDNLMKKLPQIMVKN
jgi:hypothetical protein